MLPLSFILTLLSPIHYSSVAKLALQNCPPLLFFFCPFCTFQHPNIRFHVNMYSTSISFTFLFLRCVPSFYNSPTPGRHVVLGCLLRLLLHLPPKSDPFPPHQLHETLRSSQRKPTNANRVSRLPHRLWQDYAPHSVIPPCSI